MPTYEYQCQKCGHKFEELQKMTDKPLTKCPKCKKGKVIRLIGGGAGLIFKGSGFYETDYKRKSPSDTVCPNGSSKPCCDGCQKGKK